MLCNLDNRFYFPTSADDTLSKNESKSQVTGGVLLATLAKCSQGFRYLVAVEERPWNGGLEICCVCEPTIQNATVLRARQRNSTAVVPRYAVQCGTCVGIELLTVTRIPHNHRHGRWPSQECCSNNATRYIRKSLHKEFVIHSPDWTKRAE